MVFTIECSNHSNIIKGGCSSIGRTTVCGTVSFLFKSGYPPLLCWIFIFLLSRIVQLVRTLISCINNENSIFSPGNYWICRLKGISSIGGATVLHTEGWVFKSPIPYMKWLIIFFIFTFGWLSLLFLLLIVLYGGRINATRSIVGFYNRIKPCLFVQSAILYFWYPIKAILSIVSPLLGNNLLIPLFYCAIGYFSLVTKFFFLRGRLPAWQTSIAYFVIWFVMLLVAWVLGCNSVMYFVFSSLLVYLGLDLHCFNSIFCNMAPYDERHKSITTTIANELSDLNKTINTSSKSLKQSNIRFEDYFQNASDSKVRGDLPNHSRYISLAKQEQLNISSSLFSLRADLEKRSSLISHAHNLYDPKLIKKEIKEDDVCYIMEISNVLVNSSRYQL